MSFLNCIRRRRFLQKDFCRSSILFSRFRYVICWICCWMKRCWKFFAIIDYRLISNGFRMIYERFAFAGFTSENYFFIFFFWLIIICKICWRFRFFFNFSIFCCKNLFISIKEFFLSLLFWNIIVIKLIKR